MSSSNSGIGLLVIIAIAAVAIYKRCDWFKLCNNNANQKFPAQDYQDAPAGSPPVTDRGKKGTRNQHIKNIRSQNKAAHKANPPSPLAADRGRPNCSCPSGQLSTTTTDLNGNIVCGKCFVANYTYSRFTRISI